MEFSMKAVAWALLPGYVERIESRVSHRELPEALGVVAQGIQHCRNHLYLEWAYLMITAVSVQLFCKRKWLTGLVTLLLAGRRADSLCHHAKRFYRLSLFLEESLNQRAHTRSFIPADIGEDFFMQNRILLLGQDSTAPSIALPP